MKYDLIFEGGGAKGMALVGAYAEFSRRGHTFGRLLGTSAGAITAALLAAGYTAPEMLTVLNEQQHGRSVFATFLGEPTAFTASEIKASATRSLLCKINLKFVPEMVEKRMDDSIVQALAEDSNSRHLFAFIERGGWFAADSFIAWLQAKLDSGLWQGKPRTFSPMTLQQFFAATQVELSLVASDTTDGRLLVLNHHTAPGCPLVWAVRMSMSIPLLWDEVIWQATWGAYQGRNLTGHTIVDGGVLSNFPLELFVSDEPQVTRLMGPKQDNPVLGLLIDEALALPQAAGQRGLLVDVNVKPGELRTVQRIMRLANTATTAHDKMVIDAFSHLVVHLPAKGYGTTEFDMSEERRAALVAAGRDAMRAYLDRPPVVVAAHRGMADNEAAHTQHTADRIALRLLQG